MSRNLLTRSSLRYGGVAVIACILLAGCASTGREPAERISVAPATQPASRDVLALDAAQVKPMYQELVPIDLPTVGQVARARNLDILQARELVESARGGYESAVGAAFPALVPTALFEHVEGTVRATEGNLVGVGFNTFAPSIAVQWIVNPGRVVYEIIAARKRFSASGFQEEAVSLETLRTAAIQYYDLVFAQTQIAAAAESLDEARELLRITRLREETGTGLRADSLRSQARLAERQQDLALALNALYNASIALTVTLHLEPTVTLVPGVREVYPVQLVQDELGIDTMLGIAAARRPDLAQLRTIIEAVRADKNATWWGAFGPQFQLGYQFGGITGHANNVVRGQGIPGNLIVNPASASGSFAANPVANGLIREGIARGSQRLAGRRDQTFGFSSQQRGTAQVGWRLSLSVFGDLKSASAETRRAILAAEQQLDRVYADVVQSHQASRTNRELVDLAHQQITSAREALRLSQANLEAGTMTTLDVLQAQESLAQARLRYAEAVVRYNQSQLNLLAAIGLRLLDEDALDVNKSFRG